MRFVATIKEGIKFATGLQSYWIVINYFRFCYDLLSIKLIEIQLLTCNLSVN